MVGTILNTVAVLAGGLIGLVIGARLSSGVQETLMKSTGICVLFLGIIGTLEEVLVIEDGKLTSQASLMLILCLVGGSFIGELLKIETLFEEFGLWLKSATNNQKDTGFVDAFVTASLTICIGAMAIIGPIKEGLTGDYSILAAKAILDFVIILILTVSKGKGSFFAALPIFLIQGSIALLAQLLAPIVTTQVLSYLSIVGSILIFCVGVNLVFGKMIKVANMLPSLLLAVLWASFL